VTKIVVDSNIIFSAILNSQGKIGQLIIDGSRFLTNHLNGILWTGDKQLINGLSKKGYHQTISTEKLYKKYLNKQLQR
jgi:predicted nucleic acid-binding protein